ncbi:uncharacterized protein E0L32_005059 [Thyridium curvatum]|uniref:non-specific serine/threonine protein kinase n=1 Tax=Thyridium curvatum TaxID=1093900 RepID=A0A507BEI8_9PEZI|nr:uncharacterized protein E0L32_005059 [Thyridium curvatum]TPX14950.1 hypothetical protein E0L32_005059 [Thyridium curvatum]
MSSVNDTLLSLDPGPSDILYRIRRVTPEHRRVLYVRVADLTIIPPDERTYGPSVIKELSKLGDWHSCWTTLRVFKEAGAIKAEKDSFLPHTVPREYILDKYPSYDIFDCATICDFNHRVSKVTVDGRVCVLKIARFPFELPSLIRELEAYHCLPKHAPAPQLLGYVFEEEGIDRVVGFLVEFLGGRPAGITDLDPCLRSLAELHRHLVHGDLCKYNILITEEGPKYIDFERSILCNSDEWSTSLQDDERRTLSDKLVDASELGRPYSPGP